MSVSFSEVRTFMLRCLPSQLGPVEAPQRRLPPAPHRSLAPAGMMLSSAIEDSHRVSVAMPRSRASRGSSPAGRLLPSSGPREDWKTLNSGNCPPCGPAARGETSFVPAPCRDSSGGMNSATGSSPCATQSRAVEFGLTARRPEIHLAQTEGTEIPFSVGPSFALVKVEA